MAKWKYQKPQNKPTTSPYLYIPEDLEQTLKIKEWDFEKNPYNDSLFKCHVIELNNEPADKIWSVWNFELKEELKKMLKGKNPNKDSVTIKITRHKLDEIEEEFYLSEIKE